MGSSLKKVEENEKETVVLQRRAIRLNKTLQAGEVVDGDMIEFQRPCPEDAIKPNNVNFVLGRALRCEVQEGDYLKIDDFR